MKNKAMLITIIPVLFVQNSMSLASNWQVFLDSEISAALNQVLYRCIKGSQSFLLYLCTKLG